MHAQRFPMVLRIKKVKSISSIPFLFGKLFEVNRTRPGGIGSSTISLSQEVKVIYL